MIKYWKHLLAGILCLFAVIGMKSCVKPKVAPQSATQIVALPKDVKEKITVKKGVVFIQTPKGTQTIIGAREGSVEVKKDGTVVVNIKVYGFELKPGIAILMSDRARMGLSFDLAYYHQLDLLGGIGTDLRSIGQTRVFVGVCWTPFARFSNTGIFLAIDNVKNPTIGLRLRF